MGSNYYDEDEMQTVLINNQDSNFSVPPEFAQQANPYGGQPQVNPYGGQPQVNPYAGQPQANPYAGQPQANPYGGQPQANPYAGQPQANPYAGQPQANPYAGQPQANPYGGQPQANPYAGQPQANPYAGQPQANPYGGQPMGAYGQPKKKMSTGAIVGIIIAIVLVIAAAITVPMLLKNGGKDSYDGTYKLIRVEEGGSVWDEDDIEDMGISGKLVIDGDEFTMTLGTESESGEFKQSGGKLSFVVDGEAVEGKYNSSDKTMTLEDDSISMKFKKK